MSTTKEPSEIELLLPWYAAGTLDAHEAQQVEAALKSDPELAQRYEWARAEFAQETAIGEATDAPATFNAKSVFAKIDALPVRRPAPSFNLAERLAEFLAALSPRTLAWSATAAALVIALQAGLLAGYVVKERNGYDTASTQTNVSTDGSFALIRFQPQATAGDIAAFLEANKLSIVGGPSGGQLYRVRVAPAKLAKDDLTRLLTTLQSDKVVGFIAATD
jgi:anti-sigma factor RsiW